MKIVLLISVDLGLIDKLLLKGLVDSIRSALSPDSSVHQSPGYLAQYFVT